MIVDWIIKLLGYLWIAATIVAYAALVGLIAGIVYGVLSN